MINLFWKKTFKVFFLSSILYLITTPAYYLTVTAAGGPAFYRAAPPGMAFILGYVHSVEQTPVETEYRVSTGVIWQWEERTKSHNAGLPSSPPWRGRFIMDGDWMKVRGGGERFDSLRYRVGDKRMGKNFLVIPGSGKVNLFELFPGALLKFTVKKASLAERSAAFLFSREESFSTPLSGRGAN